MLGVLGISQFTHTHTLAQLYRHMGTI